jgi:catechol 2,3-dioxygenase-like lactoylglutathione lyase family enzyme
MAIELNHTIVAAKDKGVSARFLAEILGLDPPTPFGPFLCVETANGVSLDYADRSGDFERNHYAFLVSEDEFDAIFARVTGRGLPYWADPGHTRANVLNDHGRGFYFDDPSGHNMEVLTRPYGT